MEGLLQEALDLGKGVTAKLNPTLEKISVWVSGKIDIPSKNIHTVIVLGGALYLGYLINGREFGIKGLVYGGLLFLLFRYLGI